MNQPFDPQTPYGDRYGGGNEPYGRGVDQQPYGEPGYGQGYGPQEPFRQPEPHGGYGFGPSPQPPKSKAPILIAVGLVAVLAIGITLFLVLRDDTKTGGGGGGGGGAGDKPTAPEITAQFFQAVDDVDEDGMQAVARGDMVGDIQDIVDEDGTDLVTFADGELIADGAKQIDDVEIAVVVWELDDPIETSSSVQLSVGLLDDGGGFKVCSIDDPSDDVGKGDDEAVDGLVDDWAAKFAEHCDYSK